MQYLKAPVHKPAVAVSVSQTKLIHPLSLSVNMTSDVAKIQKMSLLDFF